MKNLRPMALMWTLMAVVALMGSTVMFRMGLC